MRHRLIILIVLILSLRFFNINTIIVESQGTISFRDIYTTIPAWNPAGTRVAIVAGNIVEIWNPSTPAIVFTLNGHIDKVLAVAWSPNGALIATGSRDNTVRVWDGSTGSPVRTLLGHDAAVTAVAWSPDGGCLVSLDAEGQPNLFVWNPTLTTGNLLSSHQGGSTSAVAFNPNGSRFAYVTTGGSIHILDGNTFSPIVRYTSGLDMTNLIVAVEWSADGSRLITGSVGGAVYIWNAATAQPILQLPANLHNNPNALSVANPVSSWVRDVAFSGDGQRVLSASGDGTLRAWDATTNQVLITVQVAPLTAAGWSPNGSQLAIVAQSGAVQILNTSSLSQATSVTSYMLVNSTISIGKVDD
jgi:WD40 repeat protein